ncbi:MAG TPA: GAF domain-containing protein [Bradyrhizobium sp.]
MASGQILCLGATQRGRVSVSRRRAASPWVLGATGNPAYLVFAPVCSCVVYPESQLIAVHNGHLGAGRALIPRGLQQVWRERILETSIARTFAALSATNEAILYAKSPEELYGQVCEAAFSSGDFLATAIFLLEPETGMLRLAAGFGEDIVRLRRIDISIAADTPAGSGVCGQAFRDRKVIVSNDFLNDARSLAWREGHRRRMSARWRRCR